MNCPDCGSRIRDINQKYCEYCGRELVNIDDSVEQKVNFEVKETQFKRRCC
ncbi:MAG: zinc-ribbon domain-containing protein [Promethearchaeota archaeon]